MNSISSILRSTLTALSSLAMACLLAATLVATSSSTAAAQYFGPPRLGYGYGPQISITLPGPGFIAPPAIGWGGPVGILGPGYPPPFALSPRHIARRQAMMDRVAARYGYPYPPPHISLYAAPPYLDAPYLEGPYALAPELDIRVARPALPAAPPLPPAGPSAGVPYWDDPDLEAPYLSDSAEAFALPLPPSEAGAFAASASRLSRALSHREDGEVWIDFLQSSRLAALASSGRLPEEAELEELAARYQGVLTNPDLAWLAATDGFADTLAGLSAITGWPDENQMDRDRSSEPESDTTEPEIGILPAPRAEPDPTTTSL